MYRLAETTEERSVYTADEIEIQEIGGTDAKMFYYKNIVCQFCPSGLNDYEWHMEALLYNKHSDFVIAQRMHNYGEAFHGFTLSDDERCGTGVNPVYIWGRQIPIISSENYVKNTLVAFCDAVYAWKQHHMSLREMLGIVRI